MHALIVQNIAREKPGIIGSMLAENGISSQIIDADSDAELPEPTGYSAVIILGGPDSANDDTLKIRRQLAFAKNAVAGNIPYLGICLGMQILVRGCGGSVRQHTAKEIGWRDPQARFNAMSLTANGKRDRLFKNVPNELKVFQLHSETVELTNGMALLAEGAFCRNQAVRVGRRAYGFQGHLELTEEMLWQWLAEEPDLAGMDKAAILSDFKMISMEYALSARRIFGNFLKNLTCRS
jgi:GMP synthase-like glutamine amidotransferase